MLIEKQGYKCAVTGWPLTPETAALDHTVPISRGGKHAIENLQIIHGKVNACKGTLLMGEFIEICKAIVDRVGTS